MAAILVIYLKVGAAYAVIDLLVHLAKFGKFEFGLAKKMGFGASLFSGLFFLVVTVFLYPIDIVHKIVAGKKMRKIGKDMKELDRSMRKV